MHVYTFLFTDFLTVTLEYFIFVMDDKYTFIKISRQEDNWLELQYHIGYSYFLPS